MTESNPFGGLDLNALMQQAQAVQQQVVAAQQELAEQTVDGTVSDGLVTVTVNCTGDLVRVKIRADSFDPSDTEDLEDLIVAAYRDAKARSNELAAETFSPLAGGLGALGLGGDAFSGDDHGDDSGGTPGIGTGGTSPLGF